MHVPSQPIAPERILSFRKALESPVPGDYDASRWLYVPGFYADYRYVLGTLGERPLICLGLNPSTARPDALDNTLKSVQRVAKHNGYDSFLMMNLYAQRATRPCDMDGDSCQGLHAENLQAFAWLLERTRDVWCAWGAVMQTRDYLADCLRDFAKTGQLLGVRWLTAGKKSLKGHPHHPLYLRKDSVLEPFDMAEYLDALEGKHAL